MPISTRIDATPKWLSQAQLESGAGIDLEHKTIETKVLDNPDDIAPTPTGRTKAAKALAATKPRNSFHGVDKKITEIEEFNTKKTLQALREHMRFILVPSRNNPEVEEVYAQVQETIFDPASGFKPEKLTQALQIFSEQIGVESFILPREHGLFFQNKIPFVTGGQYVMRFIPLKNGEKMPIIEDMDHHLARFLDRSYAQASYINRNVNKPIFFLHPEVRDGDESIVDDLTDYGLKELHEKVGDSVLVKDLGGLPQATPNKLCNSIEDALGGIDRAIPPHEYEWLVENHDLTWDPSTGSIVIMGKKSGSLDADRGRAYKLLFTALPGEIGVREATSADAVTLDFLADKA